MCRTRCSVLRGVAAAALCFGSDCTHGLDAGDEKRGPRHGAVEHLEGEVPVLAGQAEALHDAAREVLQGPRGHAALQRLVRAVPPAAKYHKNHQRADTVRAASVCYLSGRKSLVVS